MLHKYTRKIPSYEFLSNYFLQKGILRYCNNIIYFNSISGPSSPTTNGIHHKKCTVKFGYTVSLQD